MTYTAATNHVINTASVNEMIFFQFCLLLVIFAPLQETASKL